MPDYFTLDYLFSIAYEENEDIRAMIDSIPAVEPIIGDFNNVGNEIMKSSARRHYLNLIGVSQKVIMMNRVKRLFFII